jgi:hypothetical protein
MPEVMHGFGVRPGHAVSSCQRARHNKKPATLGDVRVLMLGKTRKYRYLERVKGIEPIVLTACKSLIKKGIVPFLVSSGWDFRSTLS